MWHREGQARQDAPKLCFQEWQDAGRELGAYRRSEGEGLEWLFGTSVVGTGGSAKADKAK